MGEGGREGREGGRVRACETVGGGREGGESEAGGGREGGRGGRVRREGG